MRFLANENFPGAAVNALRDTGHDVRWVRTDAPGSTDEQVLAVARAEGRILLTFDKDFGELVFRRGAMAAPGLLLFRLPLTSPEYVAQAVVHVVRARDDWEGHFSSIEIGRIRMRKLPKGVTP